MPIIREQELLNGLSRSQAILTPATARPLERPTGTGELLAAAFERENLLFSFLARQKGAYEIDENYNPLINDNLDGYMEHVERFYHSRSRDESDSIKSKIDRERELARTIASVGFTKGFVATVAAGITSPENLVPFASAIRMGKTGISLGRSMAAGAGIGAASASMAELGLQATQMTRTPEESWANVAGAAIISGLLTGGIAFRGQAAQAYSGLNRAHMRSLEAVAKKEILEETVGDGVVSRLPEGYDTLPSHAKVRALTQAIFEQDAEFGKIMGSNTLGGRAVKKVVQAFAIGAPTSRLKSKTHSVTARILGGKLAHDGLISNSMGELAETTEGVRMVYEANAKGVSRVYQDSFRDYVNRARADGDVQILTSEEYSHQLYLSLFAGEVDGSLSRAAQETIENARVEARKFFDGTLKDAKEAGLIHKGELVGDEQYGPTLWEYDHIRNNPGSHVGGEYGFSDWLVEHGGIPQREAENIVNSLLDGGSQAGFHGVRINETGRFKQITLQVPRSRLAEGGWISTDFERAINLYAHQVSGEIALARHWNTFRNDRFYQMPGEVASLTAKYRTVPDATREITLYRENLRDFDAMAIRYAHFSEASDKVAVHIEELGRRRNELVREIQKLEAADAASREATGKPAPTEEIYLKRVEELDEVRAELEDLYKSTLRHERTPKSAKIRSAPKEIDLKTTKDVETEYARLDREVGDFRHREARAAVNLERYETQIKREYAQSRVGKTDAEKAKINREQDSALDEIAHLKKMLTGRGLIGDDPMHWSYRTERSLRKFAVIARLGKVVISSLPDIAMHAFVNGGGRSVRALMPLLRRGGFKEAIERDEMARLVWSMETTSGANRFEMISLLGDKGHTKTGAIEGVLDRGVDLFSHLSLMRFWNSRHKVIASLSIQDRIIADSFRLVSGDIDEAGRRNLAASGVSKDMAARIVEMAKTHGQQESVLGHKFWHSQSHKWDDDIRTQFQAVVLQDVNRTIVTPGLGEQPRFMSKTGVRLLGMFRSHALASNTRIVGSGLQRWDASVASGATGMIAIGGMVYALRQWMAGRDISDDPRKWIVEAVDRSGVTGLAMDVNNIMEKITRGKIGVNSALGLGAEVTTRYQSRNMLDAFIGPVMGLAEDIVGVASSPFREGGMTAGDARRIRKMIPYSSIFYWEWLFRTIEEGATSSLSLRGAQ